MDVGNGNVESIFKREVYLSNQSHAIDVCSVNTIKQPSLSTFLTTSPTEKKGE